MTTDTTIEDTARRVVEITVLMAEMIECLWDSHYMLDEWRTPHQITMSHQLAALRAALAREVLRLTERVTFLESILDHNVPNWQTRTLILGGALAVMEDERTESPVSDAR